MVLLFLWSMALYDDHRVRTSEGILNRLSCVRISHPLATVDHETIFVAAWRKPNGRLPAATALPAQWRLLYVPIIEAARNHSRFGLRHIQDELNRFLDRSLRGGCWWRNGAGDGGGTSVSGLH